MRHEVSIGPTSIVLWGIVTLYTMLRHWMSRPALTVSYNASFDGLSITFSQKPIGRLRRRIFGTRSPLVDLTILYWVEREPSDERSAAFGHANLRDMFGSEPTTAPVTVSGARSMSFQLLRVEGNQPLVPMAHGSSTVVLAPGTYGCRLAAYWDGGGAAFHHGFGVTDGGRAYWVDD